MHNEDTLLPAPMLVPVKLMARQLEEIKAMDTTTSEWIREAVEDKLIREVPGYAKRYSSHNGSGDQGDPVTA